MNNKLTKLMQKAEALRTQNKLAEALDVYKELCRLDQKNPNAWMIYGSVAGNINKLDIAESAFRKACKLANGFGKQNELLLQVLELQGKHKEAIKILLDLSKTQHAPNDITLRIGVLYGKAGEYDNSIIWLNKFINAGNNSSFAHHCLASAYESQNKFNDAEKHFKAALSINSNDHVILNNYAALLQKTGDTESAINTYKQSIKINNQYPVSQYNLADLLLALGNNEEALELFTKAVELKPDYTEAIIGQGRCYYAINANLYALEVYNKALAINPSSHEIYANIGHVQVSLGDFDAAENSFNTAIELDPHNIVTQCALVELYEKRGLYKEAETIIRPLLKSQPGHRSVLIAYSALCKKLNECNTAIDLIDIAVKDDLQAASSKATLHFKAGKILDGMKNYDDAFRHYSSANKLQSFQNDPAITRQSFENITRLFSKNNIETLPKSTIKSHSPIFIVGMPRSGTTLVEQIIASHPDVYGAGELPYLTTLSRHVAGDFLSGKNNITTFDNIEQEFLNALSEQYIQSTMNSVNSESFFTDKMPHNFTMIGLINMLFPDSKIIHCQRNPVDNCLSIFFSEFNSRHPYATDLKNLAEYYTGYYEKLMEHWYKVNNIPLYNIVYEDIVADQETSSRKLIDFCGLDWNDSCLDFHKSKRDVATISYDQVRQPIYKHSVARWHNYEKHITPLLEHFKKHI